MHRRNPNKEKKHQIIYKAADGYRDTKFNELKVYIRFIFCVIIKDV